MTDARGKRPESVLVVIHTESGEVLLLRRCSPQDFWQSVTGSLEWGERAQAAAEREVAEECGWTGLPIEDCRMSRRFVIQGAWRSRYHAAHSHNLEHWYSLRLPGRRPVNINPAEHLEFRWVAWQDAAELASSRTNREAILHLCAGDGPPD